MIISQTESQLLEKQQALRKAIVAEAKGSDSDTDSNEEKDDNFIGEKENSSELGTFVDNATTQFNSSQPAENQEEEKYHAAANSESRSHNSYRSDFSSVMIKNLIEKPKCLQILQQIIAVKREQAFCQSADKEIFMTDDKSKKRHT